MYADIIEMLEQMDVSEEDGYELGSLLKRRIRRFACSDENLKIENGNEISRKGVRG